MTVEQKVADTILQKDSTIIVDGVEYKAAPPSTATLIMVSAEISKLPKVDASVDVSSSKDVLPWVLRNAKDCCFLGDIVAILILGAKGITEIRKVKRSRIYELVFGERYVEVNNKEPLVKTLLENLRPEELQKLALELLNRSEIGAFFYLTTFLLEINLTKPKREVETTVSGL